jgi:hypothetical protein
MALFKSRQERQIERDMKIRQGIRRIERSIREQGKFQDEFIRNAQRAKAIGDDSQYRFIRNALQKTCTIRRLLERQLLSVKNALLIKRQAEANAAFAESMGVMAEEIGRLFGETDLVKTQAEWEKAMVQSQSMEERMGLFLDSIEDIASQDAEISGGLVSDQEIDRMIDAEAEAEHRQELDRLAGLRAELDALKAERSKEEK